MKTESKIVLPDLSFKVIGSSFKVANSLGWGLPEKDYQRALAREFTLNNISFREQVYIPIQYEGVVLSKYFADFIIEDKIFLEIKVVRRVGYSHARQLLTYLRAADLRLGILVYFTEEGVKYRRILNSHY